MSRESTLLYYEAHITIDPVFEDRLELAGFLAIRDNFKLAKLLMQKREEDTPEASTYDTFMTGHSISFDDLRGRTMLLVSSLQNHGFNVRRYKIEDTLVDSRHDDEFNILNK